MAIVVQHVHEPPETLDYDPRIGEVALVRQYKISGVYPQNVLAIPVISQPALTPGADELPGVVSLTVYKPTEQTYYPWGAVTVNCYLATTHVENYVAKSTEADSYCNVSVTYRGYTAGVVGSDLDVSTGTALQIVDLDYDHVDADGRPRAIGAEGEGVNVPVPKGEWHITEIFDGSGFAMAWYDKLEKIAILTGTVNEPGWRPMATAELGAGIWPSSMWLYMGATFEQLVGPYYRIVHTFEPDLHNFEQKETWQYFHRERWRYERKEKVTDADLGGGETGERVVKRYGPEQISKKHPVAGEVDIVGGRDLSQHRFAYLGL